MMIVALAVAAFASKASANEYDAKYFTIDKSSVKVELLETKGGTIP